MYIMHITHCTSAVWSKSVHVEKKCMLATEKQKDSLPQNTSGQHSVHNYSGTCIDDHLYTTVTCPKRPLLNYPVHNPNHTENWEEGFDTSRVVWKSNSILFSPRWVDSTRGKQNGHVMFQTFPMNPVLPCRHRKKKRVFKVNLLMTSTSLSLIYRHS